MNPGNGIETVDEFSRRNGIVDAFKLMNPGNGIETLPVPKAVFASRGLSN